MPKKKPAADAHSSQMEILYDAIERLAHQVLVLTMAVDELTLEIERRNQNVQDADMPQPFALRSMPVDPCADDWAVNRVSPERVAQMRAELTRKSPAGRLFE